MWDAERKAVADRRYDTTTHSTHSLAKRTSLIQKASETTYVLRLRATDWYVLDDLLYVCQAKESREQCEMLVSIHYVRRKKEVEKKSKRERKKGNDQTHKN